MDDAGTGARRYHTKQRDQIIAVLTDHPDECLTARQVSELLAERGCEVGVATVYRNLDRFAEEGLVAKMAVEGSGGVTYRAVRQDLPHAPVGFHLKCEVCGSVTPIECEELTSFYDHFARHHHVRIDPVKTVLYGTCPACMQASEGETTPHTTR